MSPSRAQHGEGPSTATRRAKLLLHLHRGSATSGRDGARNRSSAASSSRARACRSAHPAMGVVEKATENAMTGDEVEWLRGLPVTRQSPPRNCAAILLRKKWDRTILAPGMRATRHARGAR